MPDFRHVNQHYTNVVHFQWFYQAIYDLVNHSQGLYFVGCFFAFEKITLTFSTDNEKRKPLSRNLIKTLIMVGMSESIQASSDKLIGKSIALGVRSIAAYKSADYG